MRSTAAGGMAGKIPTGYIINWTRSIDPWEAVRRVLPPSQGESAHSCTRAGCSLSARLLNKPARG